MQKNKKIRKIKKNPFRTQRWLHSPCVRRREQRTVGTGLAGFQLASAPGPGLEGPPGHIGRGRERVQTRGSVAKHGPGATVVFPHRVYSGRKRLLLAISLPRCPWLPLEPTFQGARPSSVVICKAPWATRPWAGRQDQSRGCPRPDTPPQQAAWVVAGGDRTGYQRHDVQPLGAQGGSRRMDSLSAVPAAQSCPEPQLFPAQ